MIVERRGAAHLVRVAPDGTATTLVGGTHVVSGAAVAAGRVVVTAATPTSAGRGLPGRPRDGDARGADRPRRRAARDRVARVSRSSSSPPSPDGYEVHGWVVTPDEERYGAGPHPTILMIHGGPFAQYTHALFDEVQVLAEAGYAVVLGNPRGSSGLRARARAGHPPGLRHGRHRRRARPARRGAGGPCAGRRAGRCHGRLVRRLPHRLADHAHGPVRRGDRGARVPRPGQLRRVQRHRLVLRPGVPRGRRRRPAGGSAAAVAAQSPMAHVGAGPHADPRHPLGAGLAVPGRAGSALVRRAEAAGRSTRSCCCSRGRATSSRGRATRSTGWPASSTCCGGGRRTCPSRAAVSGRSTAAPQVDPGVDGVRLDRGELVVRQRREGDGGEVLVELRRWCARRPART